MQDFLQRVFDHFGAVLAPALVADSEAGMECALLDQAIERVVDEVHGRLRAIPGYRQRLRAPVGRSLAHIDRLVDEMPPAFLCGRATFFADRRVSAFFVNPQHIGEVFSATEEVRQVFADHPDSEYCWGLLCMRRQERERLGVALVGEALMREVPQRVVNFSDHRVLSPGASEQDARRALKCCIFHGLLKYARQSLEREKAAPGPGEGGWREDRDAGRSLSHRNHGQPGQAARSFTSIEEQFAGVARLLEQPQDFLGMSRLRLSLDRMNTLLGPETGASAVEFMEIRIAGQGTRVGALVGFAREELRPVPDLVRGADAFLAM